MWQLTTTASDWKKARPESLVTMLGQLHLIRAFEELVLDLAGDGLVHGPAHSSIGQEGGAVGSVHALRASDAVNGSHRGHHQFLAKAIAFVSEGPIDPSDLVTEKIADVLRRTLAEILGLDEGFGHGRGGSMHLQWMAAGAMGTNAIVGGGVPMAAGKAWAQKRAGTSDVTLTYFGDGAVNIGSVLETFNLAAAWDLPLGFFIENNQYAVSTTVTESTRESRLAARGFGFAIPAWRVDGMDPLAVQLATQDACERMRAGEGPVIVEADVYRFYHQNGPFAGSAFGYRSKDEERAWRDRDPVQRMGAEVLKLGHLSEREIASIRDQAVDAMRVAASTLVTADKESGRRRIVESAWPDPAFVDVGIRSDARELDAAPRLEPAEFTGTREERKFIEVIAEVTGRRMAADDRYVILGEDVHKLAGGTNGATKGLADRFHDRVLGTPISENAFVGLGGGMALDGRYRPVVEFMYPDFMWVAADQVFNQIGKVRHMFGGQHAVPLVLRTKVAIGSGYGSQHLMDPAGIFAASPGWRIVAPSTAADYIGLFNAAMLLDDPVLVIEHVDLYGLRQSVPADAWDYVIEPGTAAVRRSGDDVTVISYLSMVDRALEAVDRCDIDADVIDLRWLDRASVDWSTIEASVQKTNNVLIVEQGARGTSYGGWLADEIHRRYFDWLDQPVERVTGREASPTISKVLERAAMAGTDEVVAGLEKVRRNWGGA
nr:alpha-ketoacid dehydrogenase subunit alpha/beta [Jiangella alba]